MAVRAGAADLPPSALVSSPPRSAAGLAPPPSLGNFTSQDFEMFPRSFCADPSSPQISAILVGHSTGENDSLRESPGFPQNFHNNSAEQYDKNPGSRNSLGKPLRDHMRSGQGQALGKVALGGTGKRFSQSSHVFMRFQAGMDDEK